MDEVSAALKKMKRHKAPGLSELVAEMIQSTEDIGTQWILDLCNGIVKEGCIPEDCTHTHTQSFYCSSGICPGHQGEQVPERQKPAR